VRARTRVGRASGPQRGRDRTDYVNSPTHFGRVFRRARHVAGQYRELRGAAAGPSR
jgi:hypothetical protein